MPQNRREWNEEMRNLARRMNQLMDEWMHAPFRENPDETWQPPADVIECTLYVFVVAEVAGLRREEIAVTIDGPTVTISGVRVLPHVENQIGVHQMELGRGAFRRTLLLPFEPDARDVSITYDAGILQVRLAKPASAGGAHNRD